MSLFAGYLYEKENKEVIEIDGKGFIAYTRDRGNIHIDIIYVTPLGRREGFGTELADKLLDKHGSQAESLTCAINTKHNDPTSSLQAVLSYGFKVCGTLGDQILLYKDLRDGK